MAPPKPPTAASNPYAAPHSGSETSPTTSPEHSSKQEDSDPNYTPNYEEPVNVQPLVAAVASLRFQAGESSFLFSFLSFLLPGCGSSFLCRAFAFRLNRCL